MAALLTSGQLERLEQAVALQRLLRACWEAMEVGSPARLGGQVVLSSEQARAALIKMAGVEAARASLEAADVQEGARFSFDELVRLAAVPKKVPPMA